MVDKNIVKERFQKNFCTYNQYALVQQEAAIKLVEQLVSVRKDGLKKILEIGCGTGFLTKNILKSLNIEKYFVNDLVGSVYDEVERIAEENNYNGFDFVSGDAENIELPKNLDAIISSSTFHWFHDFCGFIKKTSDLIENKGVFAFTTFGENNFIEIRSTLNIGLSYPTLSQIVKSLEPNYKILFQQEWMQRSVFENPKDVLKHLKLTGVNGIKRTFFGKSILKKFESDYRKTYSVSEESVSLTYHPIIIIAEKK